MGLLVGLLAVACAVPRARADDAPTAAPAVDTLTYPLGPGDVLRVDIVGEADMSGERRVDGAGEIELPYAGKVKVGGLTLDAATALVTARLGAGFLTHPQVHIEVAQANSQRVEVSGGLARPGVYTLLAERTTVSEIVVRAGGLIDPATPTAEIWRDGPAGRQVIPIDLERINRGDAGADVPVLPGDHFSVPPPRQVFVDGKVTKPGGYVYRDGMTLTQAIADAGGAAGSARTTAVQILRGNERITVNVKRIFRGQDPDVTLRPGDQVYVPESVF